MDGTVGCEIPVCDFCRFYAFNGDTRGVYLGNGRCEHPDHPRPADPGDGCDDFDCRICHPKPLEKPAA